MMIPTLFAHGALGAWDELIFIGVVTIFAGVAIYTWFKGRGLEPEIVDDTARPASDDIPTSDDHFKLD